MKRTIGSNVKRPVKPTNNTKRNLININSMISTAIALGIGGRRLTIILAIKYLQFNRGVCEVGEIHAMCIELTRASSEWKYESCRNLCNEMSKDGALLEKHKENGTFVSYTLTEKAKELLAILETIHA